MQTHFEQIVKVCLYGNYFRLPFYDFISPLMDKKNNFLQNFIVAKINLLQLFTFWFALSLFNVTDEDSDKLGCWLQMRMFINQIVDYIFDTKSII